MTSILFQGTRDAYLPEITAYQKYLGDFFPHVKSVDSRIGHCEEGNFDIVWRFMGVDHSSPNATRKPFLVHEYNSLSTGFAARFKNRMKVWLNQKPDKRIFLNADVKRGFSFNDDIPFSLRDMGIDPAFFKQNKNEPHFDFIYVGSLDRGKIITAFLDCFAERCEDLKISIVGSPSSALFDRYKGCGNIVFQGRVPYNEIPAYMRNAKFGVNLMPDRYPFNLQTSTKLLEYCAAGLNIISTKYQWVESFSRMHGGNFFWLEPDFSNFSKVGLTSFDFKTPDVGNLGWNNIIQASGIFDFLK